MPIVLNVVCMCFAFGFTWLHSSPDVETLFWAGCYLFCLSTSGLIVTASLAPLAYESLCTMAWNRIRKATPITG